MCETKTPDLEMYVRYITHEGAVKRASVLFQTIIHDLLILPKIITNERINESNNSE